MQGFEGNEPRIEILQKVYIGRRFHLFADVELTYDSRTGGKCLS